MNFLGTGIRDLPAAKRYLRRKWNLGLPEPIVSRPGALFYVTARSGGRVMFLLGPFVSHMTALSLVPQGRLLHGSSFAAVGTASLPEIVPTKYGRGTK